MDKKHSRTPQEIDNQYDCDEWKARRAEILEHDGNRCVRCRSEKFLEVHHLVYYRNRPIWQYTDQELVTLCRTCHHEVHHYKDVINESLSTLMLYWCHGMDNSYYDTMQTIRHFESMNAEQIHNVVQLCASFAFDKEAF